METLMDGAVVTVTKEGPVATILMNRPTKMNAFTAEMMREMIAALDITDANDGVRAVIVTGAGDRAFCAGADMSSGAETFDYDARAGGGDENYQRTEALQRDGGGMLTLRMFQSLKPLIGAINGAAVGIGVTMTLPMDVRLASDTARFGFVFNRRGINPEAASSWFLPRLVGISKALEWCYKGHVFPASEALEAGLVKAVYPADQLMDHAMALALDFAANTAPVSNALTRQMMWRMMGQESPMDAHIVDSPSIFERGRSPDAKEGVMSFLEKRPPVFTSKVSTDMPTFYPWWDEEKFEWISKL